MHNTLLQVKLIGRGTNQSTWEKSSLTLYIDELPGDYCYCGDILLLQRLVLLKCRLKACMMENRGRKKPALCCPPVADTAQPSLWGTPGRAPPPPPFACPTGDGAGRWRPPRRVAAHARRLCLAVAVAAGRGSGLGARGWRRTMGLRRLLLRYYPPGAGLGGVGTAGWLGGELSVTTAFLACAPCSCGALWGTGQLL